MSAVCGLCFTGFRWAACSCKQRFQFILIAPNKATKQSCDLSVCSCVIHCLLTILRNPEQDVNAPLLTNKIPMSPQDLLNSEIQASCYHLRKGLILLDRMSLSLGLGLAHIVQC